MSAPENPPAFPEVPGDFNAYEGREGMSLRDWFSGQALSATVALAGNDERLRGLSDDRLASWAADVAFKCADAMLAARQASTVKTGEA